MNNRATCDIFTIASFELVFYQREPWSYEHVARLKGLRAARLKSGTLSLDGYYANESLDGCFSSFYSDLDLVFSQMSDLVGLSSRLRRKVDKLDIFCTQDDSRGFLVLGKKMGDSADHVGIRDSTEDWRCRAGRSCNGSSLCCEEVCSSAGEASFLFHGGGWCFGDRGSRFLRSASEVHDWRKKHGKKFD